MIVDEALTEVITYTLELLAPFSDFLITQIISCAQPVHFQVMILIY
jgi:hypothetical protein